MEEVDEVLKEGRWERGEELIGSEELLWKMIKMR